MQSKVYLIRCNHCSLEQVLQLQTWQAHTQRRIIGTNQSLKLVVQEQLLQAPENHNSSKFNMQTEISRFEHLISKISKELVNKSTPNQQIFVQKQHTNATEQQLYNKIASNLDQDNAGIVASSTDTINHIKVSYQQ